MNEAFDLYLKKIKPTQSQLNLARDRREILIAKVARDTKIMETLNSGSYAKGTSLSPLEDIDVFLVLPLEEFTETEKILKYIFNSLTDRYGTSGPLVRLQKRSVGIRYAQQPHVDAIPAVAPRSNPRSVQIYDRTENVWIKTSVRQHIQFLNNRSKKVSRLKNIIRILKKWKSFRRAKYRSFTIELLASKVYEQGMVRGWLPALTQFFKFITQHRFNEPIIFTDFYRRSAFRIPNDPVVVMDPANPLNNVSEKITESTKRSFLNSCMDALRWCEKAVQSDAQGYNRIACQHLRNVLGNEFPIR